MAKRSVASKLEGMTVTPEVRRLSQSGPVLVTGASGFIGRHLLEHSSATSTDVRTLPRDAFTALCESAHKVDSVHQVLRGCSTVVHLAARAHVLEEQASPALLDIYRKTNVAGTHALARAAAALGVRRFIFVSSIRVNGGISRRPFQAADVPAPAEPYAVSKYEAELGLWDIARVTGLEVVVVRPPLVYGPDVKANFLRLLGLSASGLPLPLGAVSGLRSLISIWNLCDLLLCCATHPAAIGQTLLASDGEDISLPRLIRVLAAAMGRPCRVFRAPLSVVRAVAGMLGQRSTFDKLTASLQVDISATRDALGWEPPVPLHDGLTRTARWYREGVLDKRAQLREAKELS